MTLIVLLFIVGVLLLAGDVFVSSFIMAAIGAVAMMGGCYIAFRDFGALAAGLAGICAVALLGGTVYVSSSCCPRRAWGAGWSSNPPPAQAASRRSPPGPR